MTAFHPSTLHQNCFFAAEAPATADVWTLANLLYELRAGLQLFDDFFANSDNVLKVVVDALGRRLPEPLWSTWPARSKIFYDAGQHEFVFLYLLCGSDNKICGEEKNFLWLPRPPSSEREAEQLYARLGSMLKYEP
jgi:hypothetical protein